MKSKIFVSYKYWDTSVYQDNNLDRIPDPETMSFNAITPRSYLNKLSYILDGYAIEKWESGDNDLSKFKDSTIASKLRDLIYDSSITIVLISPEIKDKSKSEDDQWIPWEISYSLREHTRNDRTSKTNALLVIVLPDSNNSYEYCIKSNRNCDSTTLRFNTKFCFKIIGGNFFNKKSPNRYHCQTCNNYHYKGYDNHYAAYVAWEKFKTNPRKYIDLALANNSNIEDYEVCKTI